MATQIESVPADATAAYPLAPDTYERLLAFGSIALLACVVAALARGQAQWALVPANVWLHLATIVVALGLTPIMLLRRRGDRRHRRLGRIWAVAMVLTAALSFTIRTSGGFSAIHILSAGTLLMVPAMVISARRHQIARHRRLIRGLVTGALLIAGAFTFPFGRMLGRWLFG
ncbi:MAG TPA: hypothetical protein VF649_05330 [Sphingomonas sp.]|jgi:uncharacterized membrane protein|uniref:hypothetical protein n=1 Tax=Sphingomonas sp. TaxID=28214 RepID=UPI002ED7F607